MKRTISLILVLLILCQTVFVLASAAGWACPRCETVNQGNFCTECGEKRPLACPVCKEPLPESGSVKFCPSCGANLAESLAGAAPAASAAPAAPAVEAPAAAPAAPVAQAAGPIHLMQLHQDVYVSTLFLTKDSYPEIVLRPGYASTEIRKFQEGSLPFVHVPNPPDAVPIRFDYSDCAFINEDKRIVYNYEMHDRFAYEDFNAKVNDDQILKDGSDGVAIRVRADVERAEALIGIPQMGKTAKLWIAIDDGKINSRMSEKEAFDILAEKITAEVERVQASLQVKEHSQLWTIGRYASFTMKHYASSHDYYVLTDPDFMVERVDDLRLEGLYAAGKDQRGRLQHHEISIKLDNYKSSDSWEDSSSYKSIKHTLSNGMDAITRLSLMDGKVSSSRTELVFGTGRNYSGEMPLYMEIYISYAYGFLPDSQEAVFTRLNNLFSHLAIHHEQ